MKQVKENKPNITWQVGLKLDCMMRETKVTSGAMREPIIRPRTKQLLPKKVSAETN
tara:strand:+ start:205 stop:372 length:168 start_codon:yes stop_codon:yes gene_type:complete